MRISNIERIKIYFSILSLLLIACSEKVNKVDNRVNNTGRPVNKKSARQVGIGATIFNDLKHAPETSYKFSWEKALSMEGDSGPYVQYAVVRAKSVLKKGKVGVGKEIKLVVGDSEKVVLRKLYRFGEVVERSAKEFSPNLLCEYLLELSRSFNGFYGGNKIVGDKNEGFRLVLTSAVAQVLENGLRLLHIEVPAKM